jgi:hypothetical protein
MSFKGECIEVDTVVYLGKQDASPSTEDNKGMLYCVDDNGIASVYAADDAGNETKISPHNEEGEWEYYSKNTKTGKIVRINMEKMIRKLEEFTGESFIEEI